MDPQGKYNWPAVYTTVRVVLERCGKCKKAEDGTMSGNGLAAECTAKGRLGVAVRALAQACVKTCIQTRIYGG